MRMLVFPEWEEPYAMLRLMVPKWEGPYAVVTLAGEVAQHRVTNRGPQSIRWHLRRLVCER